MPEMPEVQAHAERLTAADSGRVLRRFVPLTFTALKTAVPAPDDARGRALVDVGRRGKFLLLDFEPVTFVVHLMQGGRLLVDAKQSAKPRAGQARWVFADDGPALLLTEQGTERKAGVWCVPTAAVATSPPIAGLGPEAATIEAEELAARFADRNMRLHGFLRDQRQVAGIGRRLANEVLHRAQRSPFVMTGKLSEADATAVVTAIRVAVEVGGDAVPAGAAVAAAVDQSVRGHRLRTLANGPAGAPRRVYLRNFDVVLSARTLPPVWQVGQ